MAPVTARCPVLRTTTVKRTTLPGVVVAVSAVLTIESPATATVVRHRASVEPPGQLVPEVGETTVLASTWFPVLGLFTVTE